MDAPRRTSLADTGLRRARRRRSRNWRQRTSGSTKTQVRCPSGIPQTRRANRSFVPRSMHADHVPEENDATAISSRWDKRVRCLLARIRAAHRGANWHGGRLTWHGHWLARHGGRLIRHDGRLIRHDRRRVRVVRRVGKHATAKVVALPLFNCLKASAATG